MVDPYPRRRRCHTRNDLDEDAPDEFPDEEADSLAVVVTVATDLVQDKEAVPTAAGRVLDRGMTRLSLP